jgi:hypothetical protein
MEAHMSINRLLLLAGVLGIGACQAPTGLLASCGFAGDKAEFAITAYQVCPDEGPVGTPATGAALPPGDEDGDASVQR